MIDLATTTRSFLHVEEVMTLTGKSRRTVYYWMARGKIGHVLFDGHLRIPIGEVKRVVLALEAGIHLKPRESGLSTPGRTDSVQSIARSA